MMVELAGASSQNVESAVRSSIDFVWHEQMDVQEDVIRRILENFNEGFVKSYMATWIIARVMTPRQRLLLHLHSYPHFPRYIVILGTLFQQPEGQTASS